MKKIVAMFLAVCSLLSCVGCGKTETKSTTADKSHMYGFFEPLWEKKPGTNEDQIKCFNRDVTVDLMAATGANAFRMMFPSSVFSKFMVDYESGEVDVGLNSEMVAYFHESIAKLKEAGIGFIVGEGIVFPPFVSDTGASIPAGMLGVPRIGETCYSVWSTAVTKAWEVLAGEFSEITYWEMGNEYNSNAFFHPATYGTVTQQGGFDTVESATANADYMYYANKGILNVNPKAVTLTPGWTSFGNMYSREIENFLINVYEAIKSGNLPSVGEKTTDPNDYFRGFSWHPYDGMPITEDWVRYNNDIYAVSELYGDGGKPVVFTEMGFADYGVNDRIAAQAEAARLIYKYCMDDMPYVESCLWFRLYDCDFDWANLGENSPEKTCGVFFEPTATEGFMPKQKAIVMQEVFGGKGNLYKWSDLDALRQKVSESV